MLEETMKKSFADETLLNYVESIPLGENPISQLNIQYRNDEDYQELKYILSEILSYPSTDLARLHKNSNRLGALDLKENSSVLARLNLNPSEDEVLVHCNCCAFPLQKKDIPFSTDLLEVNNIGISTYLYFRTLINLSILMCFMTLVYGIFALVTNVLASLEYKPDDPSINAHEGLLILSLGSKQLNPTDTNQYYWIVQCWLGLATVVGWGFLFFFIKYKEKDKQIYIQQETKSASDFSVMLQDVPADITKQQLQKQLDEYYDSIDKDQIPKSYQDRFVIQKLNLAKEFYLEESSFHDEELTQLIELYEEKINMFAEWILERRQKENFSIPKEDRKVYYEEFKQIKQKKAEKYERQIKAFMSQVQNKEKQKTTTTAFVTFQTNHAKLLFLYLNKQGVINIVKNLLCCWDENHFHLSYKGKIKEVKVKQAPEPEDIRWTNMGQTSQMKFLRKSLTYLTTVIILGVSFGVIYLLNEEQIKNEQDTFLSLVISIALVLMNTFMLTVTRALTVLEREFTETSFHTSLAIKSIISQLLNAIAIPAIVNILIESNIYNMNGLAFDTLTLGVINSFSYPLMKTIEYPYFLVLLQAWWYTKPENKLKLNQQELNMRLELIPFDLGYQYIYIVMSFLFVCYFVSLQPILPLFAVLGFIWMFWAQKYSIFYRMKRPFPGTDMVNTAMHQLIYLGPLVFTLGNLTWSNFLGNGPNAALIPNIISLGLSLIIAVFPYEIVFTQMFQEKIPKRLLYSTMRICFSSEYDRLNPSTSTESIEEYFQYVKKYQENTKEDFENVKTLILGQSHKGKKRMSEVMPFFCKITESRLPQNRNLLNKIFPLYNQKVFQFDKLLKPINPLMKKKNQINFIQNWKKKRENKNNLTFLQLIDKKMPNSEKNRKIKPMIPDQNQQNSFVVQKNNQPFSLLKKRIDEMALKEEQTNINLLK